ncbi:hypothetical protein ACX0KM_00550 [Pseudomonas promysalinigenes]
MKSSVTATYGPGPVSALHQDYQRFLQANYRRPLHKVQAHPSSFRSPTVNTDAVGLRYSHFAGKRYSAVERGNPPRVNLLIGGSAAMGIGASCDEHTVASHLCMLTGEIWLNLAGCGLNASQELLLFLTHQHRLGEVGHVVLLSGLNSLAHEALDEVLASPSAPPLTLLHQAYLNSFHEGTPPAAPARRAPLWQRLGQALATPRDEHAGNWQLSAPDKRLARAADSIGRTLRQWEQVLADSHATLTFILQPLLPWCRETLPIGEQKMMPALQRQPGNFERLLEGVLDSQLHMAFFRRIKRQAEPVPCYDMNSMLSSSAAFGADQFVDRLHLNDLGNNALAKVITAKLGLAQERHAPHKITPINLA